MSYGEFHKKYSDGRRNNGGARIGAGRPYGEYRKIIDSYLLEKIVVKEFRHGQMRRVKKTILKAMLDKLRAQALKFQDIKAARLYFDITLGKPVLELEDKEPRYRPKTVINGLSQTRMIK